MLQRFEFHAFIDDHQHDGGKHDRFSHRAGCPDEQQHHDHDAVHLQPVTGHRTGGATSPRAVGSAQKITSMNPTFTIDEDVIRRLVLRRDREDFGHQRSRQGHTSPRFWRQLVDLVQEPVWFVSRAR